MDKEDTETKGEGSTVRAVDRAIAILQCFTADKPALSVLEIQRRVGLSRPTLYRLLQTLAATGLVKAEGDPQRFRLAHGVMELAHVWLAGLDRVDVARPILEQLRESTGETAAHQDLQLPLALLETDRATPEQVDRRKQLHARSTKLRSICRPTVWLFSG